MGWPRIDGLRTMEIGTPGAMRKELTGLVLAGPKRGTAGLLSEYADEGEELERVGEVMVLVDDDITEIGRIRITAVDVVAFGAVSDEFARSEGEGYAGRREWAVAHRAFWERGGNAITDATPVVCVGFDLL
ncbi:ASCH domain-containing protein [Kineosporia sp. NBRC 101731]|uniref:ASCH domain-containing protein n=1 Tax=Kineosporia sp. NBRC 101731 TaxID=3032199 RepID=UPI0024A01D43|nr:ASCH domain-containing protein [Kineosporia sp. NBRC 101731]GLY33343.1 hypothetical protein Kisp02_67080 [Kineosporia sp. NBRC 101731]